MTCSYVDIGMIWNISSATYWITATDTQIQVRQLVEWCVVFCGSCVGSTARGVPAGGCSPHVPLENSFHSDQSDSAHTQPTLLFLTSMSPPTIFIVTLKPITNHGFRLWLYTICGVCYTPASKHYSIMVQQFDHDIKGDNNCNLMGISCYTII